MKKVWNIILTIALFGIVGSLGYIAWNLYGDIKGQEVYEETQSIVTSVVTATPTPVQSSTEDIGDTSLTVEAIQAEEFTGVRDGEAPALPEGIFSGIGNPINFEVLQNISPDLYAWIRISEIGIDLPIANHPEDDYYYLEHDMYGDVNRVGCPFTLNYNSRDFSDPNTIIYGHNMETGTMFAPLHAYEDKAFFDNNEFVYIYTPDMIRIYQIFSARYYDDRDIMAYFDFTNKDSYQEFLNGIFETRDILHFIRDGVDVTTNDRIITLSTCISGQPENRYLIHAKLVWEGNEEELSAAQAEMMVQPEEVIDLENEDIKETNVPEMKE